MPSRTRLGGALDQLFAELSDTVDWEREVAAEARAAVTRRERLAFSIRAAVDALDPPDREPHLARLRALLGAADPVRPRRRPTPRTRAALRWLAKREPASFTVAELRAHFEDRGLSAARHYLPTLLHRWSAEGIVTRTAHGRFRINRDHPDLAGA